MNERDILKKKFYFISTKIIQKLFSIKNVKKECNQKRTDLDLYRNSHLNWTADEIE